MVAAEEKRVVATVAEQAVEKEEADVRVERREAVRGAAVVAGTARVMARVMTVAGKAVVKAEVTAMAMEVVRMEVAAAEKAEEARVEVVMAGAARVEVAV